RCSYLLPDTPWTPTSKGSNCTFPVLNHDEKKVPENLVTNLSYPGRGVPLYS
ncbi:hypothetical protein ILYODFUR_031349, partial [Ilyodon furcidens]